MTQSLSLKVIMFDLIGLHDCHVCSWVLDLLEEPNVPFSPGFRNQLDRAALSVSNNIAEGFERVTTNQP